MAAIWEESELSSSMLLVMLALADHANDEGVCWPSVDRLARRSRVSRRQVQRILQLLTEAGHLEALEEGGGRGRTTVYRVLIKGDIQRAKDDTVSSFAEEEGPERVTSSALKGDISDTKGDIASHTHVEPPIEPSIEPSKDKPQQQQPRGGGGGLAEDEGLTDFQAVAQAWEAAQFAPGVVVVQEHLRRWIAEYGAAEVLEAISIAVTAIPDMPGKYVDGTLKKRRQDAEYAVRLAERVQEAQQAPAYRGNGPQPPESVEPLAVRVLREIAPLADAPMAVEGNTVRITVPDLRVAEDRLRKQTRWKLGSAGLAAEVTFVQEGAA